MKDWNFSEIWNNSTMPVMRQNEPRDRIYASELGQPMVDRYLKMMGVPYSSPPNYRSLRKFHAGEYWEWIVAMILKNAGLIISQQERVYFQYDGCLQVSGKIDFLAGGSPDWEKARAEMNVYDLPEFVRIANNKVIDQFEQMGTQEFKKIVLEIKSCSAFVFKVLEATDKPMAGHALQNFHYLKGLGMDEGHVVYIEKDSCLLKEFPIYNPSSLEEIYRKDVETISGYYKAKQQPPLEKLIGFENGKFTVSKGIEYSNYIEMLYGFKTPEEYRALVGKTVTGINSVVRRVLSGAKMTANNLEKIAEIKKYYPNFDELMDEVKLIYESGKLVDEEDSDV